MVGGRYRPLSEHDVDRIVGAALDLLENVGMGDPIPTFVEVVTGAGGRVDDEGRLHFPRALVEDCIDKAAKRVTVFGFNPKHDLDLSGERVHFGTAGAALEMLDAKTRAYRPAQLLDLYDLARLAHHSDHIHFFARPIVARDIEETRDLDLNTAYTCMISTDKPIGTAFFNPKHVYEAVEMFDMALGAEGAFRERPFCKGLNTFVVPPMRYAEDSCECLVAQVRCGMTPLVLSAGQAGATAPTALAGALVQGLAECLSGIAVVNLLKPGHPAIVGLWPFVSDLRTGSMSGGSGEEAVLMAAAAQIINQMGLPSGVPAGMTDSKLPDIQAGYEKGMTVSLAAAAGANMIYESASMLGSLLGNSLESFVIDNEMVGAISRTVRGIEVTDETLSTHVVENVIKKEAGHFLGQPQTLSLMKTEYLYPKIGDRLSPKQWAQNGSTDMTERAHDRVREILRSYFPTHISKVVDDRIRERFPIRLPRKELKGPTGRW
jgi:trimethylamine--corrinoid protein Co-methyltransferase